MKRVLFFFLLILSIHFINAQPLSQRLDALLHEEVLKTSEVGIAVFDLTTGKSVYRYQDDKLYRPASVEKIITSVTALAQLGADYTMDTGLRYRGKIENDTLKGSLYHSAARHSLQVMRPRYFFQLLLRPMISLKTGLSSLYSLESATKYPWRKNWKRSPLCASSTFGSA